jgi:epoxyqueuosine reductase
MSLADRIWSISEQHGSDYWGVADLTNAQEYILRQGGERVARYPRAVVIGMVLVDTYVNLLPEQEDPSAHRLYRHYTYDVINTTLDNIALLVANMIQREGYQAFPVPASQRTSNEKIAGPISHKLAAHLAGFGWIGKSCLLVTPDHGPRVRWITILTDAPLQPTGRAMESRCGKCTACVDACPVGAFTGREFHVEEPREARFDAAVCDRYFKDMEKKGKVAACGMCLYSCPYGRKKKVRK